jgi:hypothetical protein
MRTETITRNLYTFDELSDRAKENAINNLSDINVDYNWWESVYEDANQVGITILHFNLDRNRHAKTTICNPDETAELILENHGIDCETYKTAKRFLDEYKPLSVKRDKCDDIYSRNKWRKCVQDTLNNLESKMEDLKEDFKKSITEDYTRILQKEFEYLQSEEAIKETILSNEYEFTTEGELA